MITRLLRLRNTLIFGGTALWGVLLVSCVMVNRAVIMPPHVPGASFVGSKDCAECHSDVTGAFASATHAKLMAPGDNAKNIGCESCHGPGSVHSKKGGGTGTIVNPAKNPGTCF
ncbi:MAG: multiheme c-type cytochrome, partial [Opitutaceae bacterium]